MQRELYQILVVCHIWYLFHVITYIFLLYNMLMKEKYFAVIKKAEFGHCCGYLCVIADNV